MLNNFYNVTFFFILPLLLRQENVVSIFLCFIEENRKKILKGKMWHPTTLESPTHGYFRFPSNLASTQRIVYVCIYICMYEFRFASHASRHKIQVANISYFIFTKWLKRFLTNRFIRLDDRAVFRTRIANAKAFRFIKSCRSIRGDRKRLILDAAMMNRVYKNDAKSTCF